MLGTALDDRFVWNGLTLLSDAFDPGTGVIKDTYQYDPYGNTTVTPPAGADPSPYRFTGRENEALGMGTFYTYGLYYLGNRYYSPGLGRFISRDPAAAPGSNLYMYAGDDPVDFSDPTGKQVGGVPEPDIEFSIGIGVGVGGIFFSNQLADLGGIDIRPGRQTNTGGGIKNPLMLAQEDEEDKKEEADENSIAFQRIFVGKIPVIPSGGLYLNLDNSMTIVIPEGSEPEAKPADTGKGVIFPWGDKTVRVMAPVTKGKHPYPHG